MKETSMAVPRPAKAARRRRVNPWKVLWWSLRLGGSSLSWFGIPAVLFGFTAGDATRPEYQVSTALVLMVFIAVRSFGAANTKTSGPWTQLFATLWHHLETKAKED